MKYYYTVLLLLLLNTLLAQDSTIITSPFTPQPDTGSVYELNALYPSIRHAVKDSSLKNFESYDPIQLQDVPYGHTGNLGGAHRPLVFKTELKQGFYTGFQQYDLYKKDARAISFYNTIRPYSDVYYSQQGQEEAIIKAKFAHNITNKLNIGVEYSRISQAGSYQYQRNRHTTFATTLWYRDSLGRYEAFAAYAGNILQSQHNGGIITDTILNDPLYRQREAVPVILDNARSTYRHQGFAFTQHFHLDKIFKRTEQLNDSTSIAKPLKTPISLVHQLFYQKNTYKYSDTDTDAITNYYGYFATNPLGIRNFFKVKELQNRFTLQFNYKKKFDIEAGVKHHLYRIIEEGTSNQTVNNLFILGKLNWNATKWLKVEGKTHYALWDNLGDYAITGKIVLDLKKAGRFEGSVLNQLYKPSLLHNRLFVSQVQVWDNDFGRVSETSFKAAYYFKSKPIKIGAIVSNHLINNYLYFSNNASPQQANELVNILQFTGILNLRWKGLHLDNTVTLQQFDDTYIHLPQLLLNHSLYYQGNIFKKRLRARVGADFRLNSAHFGDNFMPLIGQYHLQDNFELRAYPALDLFVNFKIQRFRGFLKLENLNGFFLDYPHYFAPLRPMRDPAFRFGISWQFMD